MTKQEFINKLADALRENMDDSAAYQHIAYYSRYIDEEVAKGKSEEEVTESLGNPRLIAKSIVDRGNYSPRDSYYAAYDGKNRTDYGDGDDNENYSDSSFSFSVNGKKVNPIVAFVLGILIIAAVLATVAFLLRGIAWIVLKIVLPITIVAMFVGVIFKVIDSFKNK